MPKIVELLEMLQVFAALHETRGCKAPEASKREWVLLRGEKMFRRVIAKTVNFD